MPCKHLAATFYLLAEAFDDDPFLILRWRGRDREALLARLRELRSGGPGLSESSDPDVAVPPNVAGSGLALLDIAPPPADPEQFWLPPPPLPPRPAVLEADATLLLRQLPAPAAPIGGTGLTERLRVAYQRFANHPE